MRVGSLFSGIGGLDLGLERAGMTVVWQSEIDPYACRVLAKHWPDVPNLGDVTDIDWENDGLDYGDGITRSLRVDLICGGYPCQPFSVAGRRRGEDDDRHLWPYFLNAIRVLRPRFALLENVPGHLALGFGRVLGDLAEVGYDAEWDCIPAAAFGAPHIRDRVFVVAHTYNTGRCERRRTGAVSAQLPPAERGCEDVADPDRRPSAVSGRASEALPRPGSVFGPQRRHSGSGHAWSVEPDVGRVAHGVPHRVDRLRALGNAVVPQVAEHIGRRLMAVAP